MGKKKKKNPGENEQLWIIFIFFSFEMKKIIEPF